MCVRESCHLFSLAHSSIRWDENPACLSVYKYVCLHKLEFASESSDVFRQQTELPFCSRAVEPAPCSELCSQEAAVVLLPITHNETYLLIPPNKAMEPKLQSWLPGTCPLTLIGVWLDPAINSSKRDNVDAFLVFHWTTSCVAHSCVFLALHSPSSWQVPLFSFYLPALQSSCLCVGLCWKAETRLGALVLTFHPSFPLSQSSVVWAACVSWALLWSCSSSQMLQEHPLVKGVEQGTVKDEKYLFLGLEIWEKALKESGWRSVFSAYVSGSCAASGHVCEWEKTSVSELSSLGMPPWWLQRHHSPLAVPEGVGSAGSGSNNSKPPSPTQASKLELQLGLARIGWAKEVGGSC